MTFHDILHFTPDNLFLAAIVIFVLYAVKSVSIVFPLTAIFISTGILFPIPIALLVTIIGLFICITIPYFIGRFSGKDLINTLTEKYPKIQKIQTFGISNELMTSYILRAIAAVPGDAISMLLGAMGIHYPSYVLGSMLGLIPLAVIQVLLGAYLDQPLSAPFIILFFLLLIGSLFSSFFFNRLVKRKENKNKNQ